MLLGESALSVGTVSFELASDGTVPCSVMRDRVIMKPVMIDDQTLAAAAAALIASL